MKLPVGLGSGPHVHSAVVVRAASTEDVAGIYRCLSQMVTWIPDESEWSEIVNRFLIQGHVRSYVAIEALGSEPPQVIGFASISFETKVRGGVIGHIEDVVVDATHRGRGLGRMLVAAILEESRRRNAYRVYLESSESNVGFYKSCGLERSGVGTHGDLLHGDRPA